MAEGTSVGRHAEKPASETHSALAWPRHAVHLWIAQLDRPADESERLTALLSDDERARAERRSAQRDRLRFAVCRALLRTLLARYLAADPAALRFRYGPHGKPELAGLHEQTGLRFSLAHADGLAIYAVASDREVGVDLERVRAMPHAEHIAARFFAPAESDGLRRLPPDQRDVAFLACWVRKEALLKATGRGLAHPLREVPVGWPGSAAPDSLGRIPSAMGIAAAATESQAAHTPARLSTKAEKRSPLSHETASARDTRPQTGPPCGGPAAAAAVPLDGGWYLLDLQPAPGYLGALVVRGIGWQLVCRNLP